VYLAFDAPLNRDVAIKVPHSVGLTADFRERFLREARATAKIHHTNVCPVYDVGADGDLPYIVMRFVAGGSLADLLKRGLLLVSTAIGIAKKLATGLACAHRHGVVHRDLKPANVLYDDVEDEMLVADFGLARLVDQPGASSGGIKGTPKYMAPEQWGDGATPGAVGPLSDVYSLGVILYELLAGEPPFTGNTLALMLDHVHTIPRPPSAVCPGLDPQLDALCLKALAKNPADRYQSANAFATVLADYLQSDERAGAKHTAPVANGLKPIIPKPPNAVPATPRLKTINLTVPGEWYSRPAGTSKSEWQKVTDTPAEVTIESGQVYHFQVNRECTHEASGLVALKGLTALQELNLRGFPSIGYALGFVQGLTSLQYLDLSHCRSLHDADFTHLIELSSLQRLDLKWCEQVDGTGFIHLKGLASLQHLDLGHCGHVYDEGLKYLKGLAAIQHLDLTWCTGLTGVGVMYLRNLTALQFLDLSHCDRVSATVVASLQKALPKCKIKR